MSDEKPSLDSLFEAALRFESAEQRAAFLDQSCGDDTQLRREVEQLLESHKQAASFLEKPPAGIDATVAQNLPEVMQAGLAPAFHLDEAVVVGNVNHSVMKALANTLDEVPSVSLRESDAGGDDPVVRPSSPEMPQQPADSRCRLDGEIARGGMGMIIKGRDTVLGRELAIKVLLDEHRDNPDVIGRFIEEAQINGQLQHPGIVPVHELGHFADNRPFFTMKLVKGKTLSSLLAERTNRAQSLARYIGIFEQICQTVAYAHSRRVIHRDLKPANIMVGAFGEVQVMDWGLAKVLAEGGIADEQKAHEQQKNVSVIRTVRSTGSDNPSIAGSQTHMGSVMGTPAYMGPEQALGEVDRLDERADVFSLGAILCEILTGQPPYVAESGQDIWRMATRGKLEDCFRRLDGCGADEDLIDLTKRCLALEPENRPRNAGVVAAEVRAYVESVESRLRQAELERVEAEATAIEERKRRKVSLALAATLVVGLVGTGAAAYQFWNQKQVQKQLASKNQQLADEKGQLAHQKAIEASKATQAEKDAVAARNKEAQHRRAAEALAKRERELKEEAERARAAEAYQHTLADIAEHRAKYEAARNRRYLYAANMQLAGQVWESDVGSAGSVDRLLAAHIPIGQQEDLRDFAWRHQWHQLHRTAIFSQFVSHKPTIAFTKSGHLLTCGGDLVIKHWRIDAAEPVDIVKLPLSGKAAKYEFSPDGTKLAVVTSEQSVIVFDTASGKELRRQADKFKALSVDFSADSSSLAILTETRKTPIWDLTGGADRSILIGPQAKQPPSFFALSPDHETLLFANSSSHSQIDIQTRNSKSLKSLTKHSSTVQIVAWAPNGRGAASGDGNGRVVLWNTETWTEALTLSCHFNSVTGIRFSSDGSRLVTSGRDGLVKVWKLPAGEVEFQFKGYTSAVTDLALSEDGMHVATADATGNVKVWKSAADESSDLAREGDESEFYRVAYSPDGNWLAAGGIKPALRNLRDTSLSKRFDSFARTVAFSHDSRTLALSSLGQVEFWSLDEDQTIQTWKPGASIGSLAFSGDGKFLAAGAGNPVFVSRRAPSPVKIWDLEQGREAVTLSQHKRFVAQVRFSPDSSRLASVGHDGTLALWSTDSWTLERTMKGAGYSLFSTAFSNDGTIVAAGDGQGSIFLWETATGELIDTLEGHGNWVVDLQFLPDGKTLASASWDQTVKLWNLASRLETRTLRGHTDHVNGLAIAPDGNALASAGSDGRVRIWSAATFGDIDDDPATLTSIHNMAIFYNTRGSYWEAKQLARKAAEGRKRILGNDHYVTLQSRLTVGGVLYNQQEYSKAASEWEQTLALSLNSLGKDDSLTKLLIKNVLLAYQHQVNALKSQNDLNGAIQANLNGVTISRQLVGEEHAMTATFLYRQGLLLREQDDLAAAADNLTQCLAIRRKIDNEDDQQLGITIHWLATTYYEAGEVDKAEALHRDALDIRRNLQKQDPGALGDTLQSLATILLEKNDSDAIDEAEKLLVESFDLNTGRENTVQSAIALARLHEQRSQPRQAIKWRAHAAFADAKYEHALPLYEQVLELEQRELGDDHAQTLATVQQIAEIHALMADTRAWARHFEEAAASLTQSLRSNPSDHLRSMHLGVLYTQTGQLEEYYAVCRDMVRRHAASTSSPALERTAKTCLLLNPSSDSDLLESGVQLARKALAIEPNSKWNQLAVGMAEYRARRYTQASYWLKQAATVNDSSRMKPVALAFLAMTQFRQGKTKQEAGRTVAAAESCMRPFRESEHGFRDGWSDALINEMILKEARATLNQNESGPDRNRLPSFEQFPVTTDPIPPRPATAGPNLLDLSNHYNAALTQNWHARPPDHDKPHYGPLQEKLQKLNGVTFDVRGVIQLAGIATCQDLLDYPEAVSGIPVNGQWQKLHFLHALGWGFSNVRGQTVGRYVIHYADGSHQQLELVEGRQLLDWWVREDDPEVTDPHTTVGWQGAAPNSNEVRLFHTVWTNPRPDTEITSIDFVSTMTSAAPFLVAITGESESR